MSAYDGSAVAGIEHAAVALWRDIAAAPPDREAHALRDAATAMDKLAVHWLCADSPQAHPAAEAADLLFLVAMQRLDEIQPGALADVLPF
jgi:hypothetical protein